LRSALMLASLAELRLQQEAGGVSAAGGGAVSKGGSFTASERAIGNACGSARRSTGAALHHTATSAAQQRGRRKADC
jgi:hypothetical protein